MNDYPRYLSLFGEEIEKEEERKKFLDYRRFVKKIIQNKISRDNYIIISLPSTFLSLSSLIVNIDLRFVLTFSLFLKFSNNFARGYSG